MRDRLGLVLLMIAAVIVVIGAVSREPALPNNAVAGSGLTSERTGLAAAHVLHVPGVANSPLAVAPDGRTIAVGGFEGIVSFYDSVTGRLCGMLDSFDHPVTPLAFSDSGNAFFAGHGQTVSSWSWPDRTRQRDVMTSHPHHDRQVVGAIHPSSDGRWAFISFRSDPRVRKRDGSPSGSVLQLDFSSATWMATDLQTHWLTPHFSQSLPDDHALVNLGSLIEPVGGVRTYQFATGEAVTGSHRTFRYNAVAASRTGLVAGFRHTTQAPVGGRMPDPNEGEVWVHPSVATAGSLSFETAGTGVRWMQFTGSGRTLAVAKWGGDFELRDFGSGRLLHSIPSRKSPDKTEPIRVSTISLSSRGTTLVAGYGDGVIVVWDIAQWLL